MQNDKISEAIDDISNLWFKDLSNIFAFFATVLLAITFLPTAVIAADQKKKYSLGQQQFFDFEIAKISLDTPIDRISSILGSQGYTETSNATYTKQIQTPGQRKSVYRIEIDDNPEQRQITYFRGQSGGRVKSAALQEKPIQADEIDMVNKLYQLICAENPLQIQKARACQPLTDALIIFGGGQFVEIENNTSAQLNASADSTIIGIKYIKADRD